MRGRCTSGQRKSPSFGYRKPLFSKNRGFTLVELLVALALSALIAGAAVAALIVAKQGFTSVDAASQLRDNGRFASDLIQRLVVQAGFQDVNFAAATRASEFNVKGAAVNPEPNILGADNAIVINLSGQINLTTAFKLRPNATSSQSGCTLATDTACANGSDVLILRYQTSEGIIDSGIADNSMINCAGNAETSVPQSKEDRVISVFHIARSTAGEPSLMCSFQTVGSTTWNTQPIVEGVEGFQVLYGVDGFTAANTQFSGPEDSVPDKYIRASQMVVGTATSAGTYSNWRRVRSLRIGLILRGPTNSAISRTANIEKLCALGVNPDVPADCVDKSGSETPRMGSEFPRAGSTIANDGRLRQTVTFTVFLRNVQSE